MTLMKTKKLTTLSKVWFSKTGRKMVNTRQREKKRRGMEGEGVREVEKRGRGGEEPGGRKKINESMNESINQ